MTPRKYDMKARSAATEATRSAIVSAAMRLHGSEGVLVTSWDRIAADAGVSTATVYRHFPTLTELIPACAREVFDIVRPPTLDEAAVQFAATPDASDRFAQLADATAHCYERGESWLAAAYRERAFHTDLDAAVRLIQDALHVLVDAAAGRRITPTQHLTLFSLIDFPFWKSLVDNGASHRTAQRTLVDLASAEARRLGI